MQRPSVLMNFISYDDGVRQQLESRTPPVSLLPNLRTIVAWESDLPLTSLFLTPRVHHLELMMYPGKTIAPRLSSLALEIPFRSPNLRSLHLIEGSSWSVYDKAHFTDALVEPLKNLQLEDFVCDWFLLSQDMLKRVLGMPDLRTMEIYARIPDLAQVMHTHPIQEARIRKFRLCSFFFHPSYLPHIISSICPSKLEVLSITARYGRSCDATDMASVISTLVNTCSPEHLVDIHIDSGDYDPTDPVAIIDFKMLKPLLQFVRLRRISLPDHPFDLTDLEIKDMAMSWPNLEVLSYWRYQYESPEGLITTVPKPSLRGLLWLATYCPKLYSLTFPFHSSRGAVEDLTEDEMALGKGHDLRLFDVGFSEIECAEEVAKFIKRVFPNLTSLVFKVWEPNNEQWEKVQELIQCS